MSTPRLLIMALGTQALLVALAVLGSRMFGVSLVWGDLPRGVGLGLLSAAGLAAVNYGLLRLAPPAPIVDDIRAVFDEVLIPLFARLSAPAALVLGAAAGLGEELFFRGLLQPTLGWLAASLLFGAAHVGGWRMLAFGGWATLMGMALGSLAIASGGLTAPVVAHGVYDMLALEYVRRSARDLPGSGGLDLE